MALGLLTLLTLALACAVGWLIALAAGHVRHRSLVTVLLSTVFIVAYFALCMRLNRSLALLMEHLDLLARYFAGWLRPLGLIGRALSGDGAAIMEAIGANRGFLLKGGAIDYTKTARILITEFRNGKLGRITLE